MRGWWRVRHGDALTWVGRNVGGGRGAASRRVSAGFVYEQREAARLHARHAQRRSSPRTHRRAPFARPLSHSSAASPPTPPPRLGVASRSLPNTVAARTTTSGVIRTPSRALPHLGARAVAVERHSRRGPDPAYTGLLSPHPIAPNPPNPRERASHSAVPTERIPCV